MCPISRSGTKPTCSLVVVVRSLSSGCSQPAFIRSYFMKFCIVLGEWKIKTNQPTNQIKAGFLGFEYIFHPNIKFTSKSLSSTAPWACPWRAPPSMWSSFRRWGPWDRRGPSQHRTWQWEHCRKWPLCWHHFPQCILLRTLAIFWTCLNCEFLSSTYWNFSAKGSRVNRKS